MDTDDVAPEIVLATKGASTSAVRTHVWLQTVRIMGSHMCLEIVGPCEGCKALDATHDRGKK